MSQENQAAVSLDSWGLTTPETLEACRERSQKWKPSLLTMARQVHQVMKLFKTCPDSKLQPKWFIMDGTLLGAYRSGKMISHDYDFDYGLCFFTEEGKMANLDQSRTELAKVAKHLSDSLDKIYTVSPRNDYSCKIEIFQESSGVHWENRGKWYNVNMDMQMCYSSDETKFKIAYFRDNLADYINIDVPSVFPLSEIEFESTTWPCPKDPKTMLEAIYGYIGTPAKFNPKTQKYEPLEEVAKATKEG